MKALYDLRNTVTVAPAEQFTREEVIAMIDAVIASGGTPASHHSAAGEPDPHEMLCNLERAALAFGHLTDDQLANGMYMCDHRHSLESLSWLTGARDRIRWLSRKLIEKQTIYNRSHAVIESVSDRQGVYYTHANAVLRVYNSYIPAAGDTLLLVKP